MSKSYLLDTNVLLLDDSIITLYDNGENKIYIPLGVLRELDNLKHKKEDTLGWQIREATKSIMNHWNKLIFIDDRDIKFDYYDDALLTILHRNPNMILITNDNLLKLKATALGYKAESFGKNKNSQLPSTIFTWENKNKAPVNQFILTKEKMYRKHVKDGLQPIDLGRNILGITPKNKEQAALFNVLMDKDIPLIAVTGEAGTGKNLCTLAAGLEQIIEGRIYSSLKVARAPVPSGRDIGYLPGAIEEKLNPWLRGLHDNLDFLFNYNQNEATGYFKQQYIDILSTTHIKGASIPNSYILIDEAQDLSIKEVKMLVTRAAVGTKIVLIGDVNQISSPYLTKSFNGLSYLIQKFYGSPLFSYVHLNSSVRSRLAQEAVERL